MRTVIYFSLMFVALGFAILGLTGCGSGNDATDSNEGVAPSPSSSELGKAIYITQCSVCHGEEAEGQDDWLVEKPDGTLPAPPLNGDGHTWHHGDGTLYLIVRDGGAALDLPNFKSAMPSFDDKLTHGEIIDVIAYVKSLWGDKQSRGVVKRESQAHMSEGDPFPASPE